MGWGVLYEVGDDAWKLLGTCRSKADWYKALGLLHIENSPQLDAKGSIRFWGAKLQSIGHPAERFFVGDLHTSYDEFGDLNACFNGKDSVRRFLTQLETLGRDFYVRLFPQEDSWLYEPLCSFLREVCERGNAIVLLWES